MKEFFFKKIYGLSLGILWTSLVLFLFVGGMVPFGLSIAWSDAGPGTSLVVTRLNATVRAGMEVIGSGEVEGKVDSFVVQDTVRQGGALHYVVSDTASPEGSMTIPASEYNKVSVLSIPVIGLWVRLLNHPIGIMALIGIPLSMLFINFSLAIGRRLLPVLSLFERRAQQKAERRVEEKRQRREEQKEVEEVVRPVIPKVPHQIHNEFVTVLKPFRGGYGNI